MKPVLVIELPVAITWEPRDRAACRCVCRFFHNTRGTCQNLADPALRARVVTPREMATEPVQICAPCYERITQSGPVRAEGSALPLAVWQETAAMAASVR